MTPGIIAFIVMFLIVFLCKIPIAYGMVSIGVVYFLVSGTNIGIVANQLSNALWSNSVILAIPLFILSANIMNSSKVSSMMFRFADGIVGRLRGGIAHVNILFSLIFSGMSGSAMADAAGNGLMEISEMRDRGYEDGFSCAVTAASAAIGPVFPPSNNMLFYSSLTGVSVGALFMGGMVPGILMALALSFCVAIIANKRKYPYGTRYTLTTFLAYTLQAIPALLTPLILLGGLYSGIVTPTEAGALSSFYAVIISFIFYKVLGLKEIKTILMETFTNTAKVCVLICGSYVLTYISAREGIPQFFAAFMINLTSNKYVFLLICNVMLLFLGMLFDNTTITVLFVPMLFPLVQKYGIDPVHFGVLFTVNMMIGMMTPPYGPLLFTVSAISNTNIKIVIRETLPFILILFVFLILLTYIPAITTFLPNMFIK